jgi:hypothetical protein
MHLTTRLSLLPLLALSVFAQSAPPSVVLTGPTIRTVTLTPQSIRKTKHAELYKRNATLGSPTDYRQAVGQVYSLVAACHVSYLPYDDAFATLSVAPNKSVWGKIATGATIGVSLRDLF